MDAEYPILVVDDDKVTLINDKTDPFHIEGRLKVKGLSNELYDKFYVVVEGTDGRCHYVDTHRGMKLDSLKEGNIVSLQVRRDTWLKTSDKNISKIASKNNGGCFGQTSVKGGLLR